MAAMSRRPCLWHLTHIAIQEQLDGQRADGLEGVSEEPYGT